jgi:hypothetical protein
MPAPRLRRSAGPRQGVGTFGDGDLLVGPDEEVVLLAFPFRVEPARLDDIGTEFTDLLVDLAGVRAGGRGPGTSARADNRVYLARLPR